MADSLLRIFLVLGTIVFFGFIAPPSFSADFTTQELGIMRDEIKRLEEDVSRWKSEAAKIKDRAKRYEKLAEDAKEQIKKSQKKSDKDHWKDSAKQRLKRAKDLRADAAALLEKVKRRDAEIAALKEKANIKTQTIQREKAERNAKPTKKTRNAFSPPEPPSETKRFTREMLFSTWEVDPRHKGDDPGVFVIVPEYPRDETYKHSLILYTVDREWKGKFHGPNELDVEGLARFTYTPKADEMNTDIPKWVRKKIEGELEWKIIIEQDGTYGTPRLITKFYPGEVEWDEKALESDTQSVSVIGKGQPREYLYSPIINDIEAFTYGTPHVNLRMKGAAKNNTQPIEGLTKLQPFFIEVFLTPEMADKAGKNISVDIKGEHGSATSIKLKSGAKKDSSMTIYTHYSPVSIANRGDTRIEDYKPMTGSVDWIMGKVWSDDEYHPGTRLDVNIENGEKVTFSYDGSSYTVPAFESWVQRGIARHVYAMRTLRGFYSFIKDGYPPASKFAKEEASVKLQMMKNYQAIMESKTIHDRIRYAVGEKYFGAADAPGGHMDARMLIPTYSEADSIDIYKSKLPAKPTQEDRLEDQKRAEAFMKNTVAGLVGKPSWYFKNKAETGGLNYFDNYDVETPLTPTTRKGERHESGYFDGVLWTHPLEKAIIESIAITARDDFRDDVYNDLPIAMAYAMYSGIASASNMDGFYTYVFGENIMGQKVQEWEKRTAGLGFLFGTILTFALPNIDMDMPSFNDSLKLTGSSRAQRLRAQAKTKEVKMLNRSSAKKIQQGNKILKGISGERIAAMKLPTGNHAPASAIDRWNTPVKCAMLQKGRVKARAIDPEKGNVIPYEFRDAGTRGDTHITGNTNANQAAPPRGGMMVPLRPKSFVPNETVSAAKGVKLADDVKPHEFQESINFYGKVEEMGPKLAKPQEGQVCNCEFVRPDLEQHSGGTLSSPDLVSRAAKYTDHDVAHLMKEGIPNKALIAVAKELGFKTVIYKESQVQLLAMEAYAYLVDQGMIVRLAVEPMGQVGEIFAHAIRIRRFGRNADGDIETITFFDPAFGRDLTMTIKNFKKVAVNDRPLIMFHPTKTIHEVDLQMGMAKQVRNAEARKGGKTMDELIKEKGLDDVWKKGNTANDNNDGKSLDQTWHDGNDIVANKNAPIKSLEDTWADGELSIPTAKIDPDALNGNEVVQVKPKKALDETWVAEDFEVPKARSAIEPSDTKAGTSKDAAANKIENKTPEKTDTNKANTPNADSEEEKKN